MFETLLAVKFLHLLGDYVVVKIEAKGCPHCSFLYEELERAFRGASVVFLAGTCETDTMWRGNNLNHIWYNEGNPAKPIAFPSTFSEFKISYLQFMEKRVGKLTDGQRKIMEEEAGNILLGKS